MSDTTTQVRGIGVFTDPKVLENALQQLKSSGFTMDNLSVIARQSDESEAVEGTPVSDQIGDKTVKSTTGVVTDAVRGATWGSLLLGLTGLAIPGIGPFIAAGSIGVSLLTGLTATGISTLDFNSLAHALTKVGIPEADARVYSEHLSRGDYLVIVETNPEQMQQAGDKLTEQGIEKWVLYPVEA